MRHPTRNAVAAALTPLLDSTMTPFLHAHRIAWQATRWLHRPAEWYVGLTGLGQRWRMFMNPPKYDEYMLLRHYVGRPGDSGPAAAWTGSELVFPAHREDRVRLAQSFRDSYTDKAIAIAISDFNQRPVEVRQDLDVAAGATPALASVARFFARRFAVHHLLPDERIVRTEIWIARVPNPPPTAPPHAAARRAVLERYYEGPVENRRVLGSYAHRGAAFTEADLTWVLEYITLMP